MSINLQQSSVVYLDGVSKQYPTAEGLFYAVQDVSLDVQPGEFYSLLGSSGSGKTTTLRLIGGFERPEVGEVFIGGDRVTQQPPYRRSVHTVFQNYALFPHMSVAENVAYPLEIARVPRSEIGARLEDVLKLVQIPELGDRAPSQLSGGQQQRVALARALVNRPKVLLLDEPLSALDAKIRDELRQELRQLQQQTNLTFIYVTHDQEEAMALSDRLAVMHRGRVEQMGTSAEIYNAPASAFVAQFIGQANFLSGKITELTVGGAIAQVNRIPLQVTYPHQPPAVGETVTLMIRPERIQVGAATADNQLVGKTVGMTYIGQRTEIQVETPVGRLKVVQLGQAGEARSLSWQAQDCIIVPSPGPEAES